MNKELLKTFANENNLDWRLLFAILMNETGAKGFDNGVIQQRYEHLVFDRLQHQHPQKSDAELRLLSTSWGIGQIMGFNFKAAGYEDVNDMVDSFIISEDNQVKGFLNFIKADKNLMQQIRAKNFAGIARIYNGPGYKNLPVEKRYDTKLKLNFNKAQI